MVLLSCITPNNAQRSSPLYIYGFTNDNNIIWFMFEATARRRKTTIGLHTHTNNENKPRENKANDRGCVLKSNSSALNLCASVFAKHADRLLVSQPSTPDRHTILVLG